MPELPEVQTVVNDLNKKIKGYEIVEFWSDWKKSIKMPFVKFKKEIVGCKIKNVKRRGKNILVYLDCKNVKRGEKTLRHRRNALQCISTKWVMLIHLKMTGHLLVKIPNSKFKISKNPSQALFTKEEEMRKITGLKLKTQNIKYRKQEKDYFDERVNQYIHHIWTLKKGRNLKMLEFSDLRKFGKIRLIKKNDLLNDDDIKKLGIEPLSPKFTPQRLGEIFEGRKSANIRVVLLDQALISGIGNIYVSEVLFEAKINPKKKAGKITQKEVEKIHSVIQKILRKAIKLRGTSDSDYRDTSGAPGGFQKVLKVYNREGKKCPRKNCKGIIKREKINQRSAYYCPSCQK